jgi:hypothetical protein
LIAVDRSDDVCWREEAPAAGGEIAKEVAADLELGETGIVPAASPPVAPQAEEATPVPVAPPALPAPSKLSARLREAIEALSPAERMALFS